MSQLNKLQTIDAQIEKLIAQKTEIREQRRAEIVTLLSSLVEKLNLDSWSDEALAGAVIELSKTSANEKKKVEEWQAAGRKFLRKKSPKVIAAQQE